MTITTVSTSAALVSALKVAQAGDTIQLAAGTYNSVSLENFHFATDVTITSLDPSHAAAMNNVHAMTSSQWRKKSLAVMSQR